MHIWTESNGEIAKCFGCGEAMDVFSAVHHLEGRPLEGKEFVLENVFYLCDMFGVDHTDIEFTEEEVRVMRARKLMRDAANVFTEMSEAVYSTLRGWDPKLMSELGIGTIRDRRAFYGAVAARGAYTEDFMRAEAIMESKKLGIPRLFGKDRLTFVIRDEGGHPVGFAARNYSTEYPDPKYMNTLQWTEERGFGSILYRKEKILYGLNLVKRNTGLRLDVFEGYADVTSAKHKGVHNVCAMCGTAFTDEHMKLIRRLGFRHVNLICDDDATGRDKMLGDPRRPDKPGYLQKFSGFSGIKLTVGFLPYDEDTEKDQRDPDKWFMAHSAEDYAEQLQVYDAFTWQLKEMSEEGLYTPEDMFERLINFLRNEENVILRKQKADQLAKATGYSVDDILAEYQRRFDEGTSKIIKDALWGIDRINIVGDKVEALKSLVVELESNGYREAADSSQAEVLMAFDKFSDWTERKELGLAGWDCGFPILNEATNGIPKKDAWMGFAGNANSGKSALLLNIGLNLVRLNKDLSVLYWSLDDPRDVSFMKWIAMMTGENINECGQAVRQIMGDPTRAKEFVQAKDELRSYIDSERLSVKGEEYGNTPACAMRWIERIRDKTGHDVILLVDSFNNVAMVGQEERVGFVKLSGWFRSNTQKHGFTVVSTLECNKMGISEPRPRLGHLYGSAKMGFDLKFVGMVYNELHEKREEAVVTWRDEEGVRRPFVEISVEKNKLAAFKGELAFKFIPHSAIIQEVRYDDIRFMNRGGSFEEGEVALPSDIRWDEQVIDLSKEEDDNAGFEFDLRQ